MEINTIEDILKTEEYKEIKQQDVKYDYFKIRTLIDGKINYLNELFILVKLTLKPNSIKIIENFEDELNRILEFYVEYEYRINYYDYLLIYTQVENIIYRLKEKLESIKPINKAKYDNKSL